jgi:hypothetical protein
MTPSTNVAMVPTIATMRAPPLVDNAVRAMQTALIKAKGAARRGCESESISQSPSRMDLGHMGI